jgi:hypothetical protein
MWRHTMDAVMEKEAGMLRRIAVLCVVIVLIAPGVFSDVCTISLHLTGLSEKAPKLTATIDFGQGSTEEYKTKSFADL